MLGRVPAARATHDEGFALALAVGHDAVAAEIATSQVFRIGVTLVRHEVADEWARHAEAVLQRAAAGPESWIYFHRTSSRSAWARGTSRTLTALGGSRQLQISVSRTSAQLVSCAHVRW